MKIHDQSPGLLILLQRLLPAAAVPLLVSDYEVAERCGGNQEPGVLREEGASFKPRIARVVSLLLKDFEVRDVTTLRAAVYATADTLTDAGQEIDSQAYALCQESRQPGFAKPSSAAAMLVAAAIELDSVRHLHMMSISIRQKELLLDAAGRLADELKRDDSLEAGRIKLFHAIRLQKIALRKGRSGEGTDE